MKLTKMIATAACIVLRLTAADAEESDNDKKLKTTSMSARELAAGPASSASGSVAAPVSAPKFAAGPASSASGSVAAPGLAVGPASSASGSVAAPEIDAGMASSALALLGNALLLLHERRRRQ